VDRDGTTVRGLMWGDSVIRTSRRGSAYPSPLPRKPSGASSMFVPSWTTSTAACEDLYQPNRNLLQNYNYRPSLILQRKRRCRGHRHQEKLIVNCNFPPPCSLLMLANIIYNHVSTGRGRFYRLEVGGLAFTEVQTFHTIIWLRKRICTCGRGIYPIY